MKAIIQRVKRAKVIVNNKTVSQIGYGFLILLGIAKTDKEKDLDFLVKKTINLRVFNDKMCKMNKTIIDIGGEMLVVSQFTLLADCRKGNRPSFITAAEPEMGEKFYNLFIEKIKQNNIEVKGGIFGAMMDVELVNDGPVTIILESGNGKFR